MSAALTSSDRFGRTKPVGGLFTYTGFGRICRLHVVDLFTALRTRVDRRNDERGAILILTALVMLLLLFIAIGLDRGVVTIVLAHTTFAMCFVSVVVSSRLASFDQSLEEAARDLGCTPYQAFRTVTLPIIAPGVIAGWLLAFTLSLDDLVIASFTSGPSATTLPIKIFSSVRLGVSPEINALSAIIIALVTIGVVTASLTSKRAIVRQRREEQLAFQ